ncbi:hypothetical protein [Mesomycoplasma neurolyticum]|uniref:Uncharacterized protein n=1 Tax=Mesomycoplasma neurolyticum TaxID=2120 RepID=A0A449A543_9BACT|nr:hypothetical protein [Mesomycoplasma neurolyticum]VEU59342.1 Uncharacterised protein [Mesomycoplasma neurolyticum]
MIVLDIITLTIIIICLVGAVFSTLLWLAYKKQWIKKIKERKENKTIDLNENE